MFCFVLIGASYFANFVADVAFAITYVKKIGTKPPTPFAILGSNGLKTTSKMLGFITLIHGRCLLIFYIVIYTEA